MSKLDQIRALGRPSMFALKPPDRRGDTPYPHQTAAEFKRDTNTLIDMANGVANKKTTYRYRDPVKRKAYQRTLGSSFYTAYAAL